MTPENVPDVGLDMSLIQPFAFHAPQATLDDLRERLQRTVWPSIIEGHAYGGPELNRMQELARRVALLDWRSREAEINQLPNFTTAVGGHGCLERSPLLRERP